MGEGSRLKFQEIQGDKHGSICLSDLGKNGHKV